MLNLTEYINEALQASLICELSSDTYKKAYELAKVNGDERAEKFLDAYNKALKDETEKASEDEIVALAKEWSKHDDSKLAQIRDLGMIALQDLKNAKKIPEIKAEGFKKLNVSIDKWDIVVGSTQLDFFPRVKALLDDEYSKEDLEKLDKTLVEDEKYSDYLLVRFFYSGVTDDDKEIDCNRAVCLINDGKVLKFYPKGHNGDYYSLINSDGEPPKAVKDLIEKFAKIIK